MLKDTKGKLEFKNRFKSIMVILVEAEVETGNKFFSIHHIWFQLQYNKFGGKLVCQR